MAKRRTTIIIEEIVGEDKSTTVFVSGNNTETLTEAKSITPKKKSAKTTTKKKTTAKSKKTTTSKTTSTSSKNQSTKSKTTSKTKSTSKTSKKKLPNNKTKKTTKSKTTNDKVQNKDKNISNLIEKPAELNHNQENHTVTATKEEANSPSKNEVHEPSEIAQTTSLEPVTKQEISLTNKEVINNPEIIDKEDNKENIDLDFTDKDKKPDIEILNAKVTLKDNKEELTVEKKDNNEKETKAESVDENKENVASSNATATLNEENKVAKVESNPLIVNESDSKEKVDAEVIDSKNKSESKELKNKGDEKPETIDAHVIDKINDKDNEKSIHDNTENGKDSENQVPVASLTTPESSEIIVENTSASFTSANLEAPQEEKHEAKKDQNDTKDENKAKKSSRFKISLNPLSLIAKLLKNKTYRGAIIGTSLLVILVAILVPVSINANKETKELSEDEFNSLKDSFIEADEFFNELTSLSFAFSQSDQENLNTTIIKLEYEYTFDGSFYSSNLKSYDGKENEPSIYNINFDKQMNSYTLATSLDSSVEPITLNEKDAIKMINETSSSYFKDYLSFNSSFVSSLLEDETIKLTYEQSKKSGDLRVFDKENGLLDIKLDSLGIVTSLKTYDEKNKDKTLYSLDATYTFNE